MVRNSAVGFFGVSDRRGGRDSWLGRAPHSRQEGGTVPCMGAPSCFVERPLTKWSGQKRSVRKRPHCGQKQQSVGFSDEVFSLGRNQLRASILIMLIFATSCSGQETARDFDERLQEVYWTRPNQLDPAYAVVKTGVGGDAWLATVHGFPDNSSVCWELIEPYRNDPSLSDLPGEYTCRALVDGPGAWTAPWMPPNELEKLIDGSRIILLAMQGRDSDAWWRRVGAHRAFTCSVCRSGTAASCSRSLRRDDWPSRNKHQRHLASSHSRLWTALRLLRKAIANTQSKIVCCVRGEASWSRLSKLRPLSTPNVGRRVIAFYNPKADIRF